jgi:Fatty acid hydroxylase superfamily
LGAGFGTGMSRERSAKFREAYRARIVGWYNGYFHAFLVFATGLSVLYVCMRHIENVSWLEWLTVPLVFLLANWFEWDLHKNFMHQQSKIKALQIIHRYHMLNHHQYFTDEDMHFHDHRDWRITIFPPYVITILILLAIPFAGLVGWVFTPNVGWLFLAVVTTVIMIYEFIHLCCHCEENWFVRYCPLINTARRHHTAHHNPRMMTNVNMNVTFPIADWLFGTSDLNRGLLGHLFNGYDSRHVKQGLPVTVMPPEPDDHGRAEHAADPAGGG